MQFQKLTLLFDMELVSKFDQFLKIELFYFGRVEVVNYVNSFLLLIPLYPLRSC